MTDRKWKAAPWVSSWLASRTLLKLPLPSSPLILYSPILCPIAKSLENHNIFRITWQSVESSKYLHSLIFSHSTFTFSTSRHFWDSRQVGRRALPGCSPLPACSSRGLILKYGLGGWQSRLRFAGTQVQVGKPRYPNQPPCLACGKWGARPWLSSAVAGKAEASRLIRAPRPRPQTFDVLLWPWLLSKQIFGLWGLFFWAMDKSYRNSFCFKVPSREPKRGWKRYVYLIHNFE